MDTNELPMLGRGGFLLAGYVLSRPEISTSCYEYPGFNSHALQKPHSLFVFRYISIEVAGTGRFSLLIEQRRESNDIRWFRQLVNRREIRIRSPFNSPFKEHYDSVSVGVGSDGEFKKRRFPDK